MWTRSNHGPAIEVHCRPPPNDAQGYGSAASLWSCSGRLVWQLYDKCRLFCIAPAIKYCTLRSLGWSRSAQKRGTGASAFRLDFIHFAVVQESILSALRFIHKSNESAHESIQNYIFTLTLANVKSNPQRAPHAKPSQHFAAIRCTKWLPQSQPRSSSSIVVSNYSTNPQSMPL